MQPEKESSRQILKELIWFSVPLVLSGILQQLYNWVDAFILGNVEGELALGAIGGTGSITSFYIMAITGFAIGIAVLAGQKYGSGEMAFINKLLSSFTLIFAGVFGVLAIAGIPMVPAVLKLIHTPSDTFLLASHYLKIIFMGIPFLAVYNVYSSVLRGVGDSKAPFYAILVSSGINVVLDILFVAVLHMGIKGAAEATVISQALMTVFLIFYTKKKHKELEFTFKKSNFEPEVLQKTVKLGVPPMIQSCVTAAGNMVLQNFMNSFGTATVIAITTAYRIDTLALLPIFNLASAISTLTAQSYGARNLPRIRKVRNAGIGLMAVVSAMLTVLVIPFGSRLIALFGAGEEATMIGYNFFVRLASFYIIFGVANAMRGYLEGIGDVFYSSVIGIVMLGARIVGSYAGKAYFGNMIIAFAEAFAWVLGFVLFGLRMLQKSKNLEKNTAGNMLKGAEE